jgi:hypothetical protein
MHMRRALLLLLPIAVLVWLGLECGGYERPHFSEACPLCLKDNDEWERWLIETEERSGLHPEVQGPPPFKHGSARYRAPDTQPGRPAPLTRQG